MLHHGDLFDVLPTFAENSVDSSVVDGPYGLGFMGKEWDTFKPAVVANLRKRRTRDHSTSTNPNLKGRHGWASGAMVEYDYSTKGLRGFQSFSEDWGREVYRVLKPGAFLLSCGAPRTFHRMACGLEDAGFVVRDCLTWLYGSGFPKSRNLGGGKGTALKPAWEPIVVAQKPFKGSISKCHEAHGTAALNIDACRLDVDADDLGRWPPNLAIDDVIAELLDEQSGELSTGEWPSSRQAHKFGRVYESAFPGGQNELSQRTANVGGASRFFYCAKPSREERDLGCEGLVQKQRDESRKAGNPGGDNPRNRGLQLRGNYHPTVKPVALMRWLVRLVTPRTVIACPMCDNIGRETSTEATNSVTEMRSLRKDLSSIGQQAGKKVLFEGLQQSGDDASAEAVRGMSEVVQARNESEPVLLEDVRQQAHIENSCDDEGLRDNGGRVQSTVSPEPSKGTSNGLHTRTSSGGGKETRSSTSKDRGSPSCQRDTTGQLGRQLGSDAKEAPRQEIEAESETDPMSTLPSMDQGLGTCQTCGSYLGKRAGRVLDCFTGSGTTGMACRYEMLEFIGIEREAEFVEISNRRITACAPLLGAMLESAAVDDAGPQTASLFSDD